LVRNADEKPKIESVFLAIAGLKQVKDIMAGNLPFDPSILQINDTAFLAAADQKMFDSVPTTVQEDDVEDLERKERTEKEVADLRLREEEEQKEEHRRREEEQRRRRLDEERRHREEENRKKREEDERKARSKVPTNIFEDADDEDFASMMEKNRKNEKLSALLS